MEPRVNPVRNPNNSRRLRPGNPARFLDLGFGKGSERPRGSPQRLFALVYLVGTIILAAAQNNVPAVYSQSDFVREGGVLSYGTDQVDLFRRAASYVDRILRGAKPAELPVQLPTKFEMVVNLKIAKSLGVTVPQSILLFADEVIE
jgi:hypothetical protein